MKVPEAVSRLEKSREFQKFKKENPGYYLVHAFTMATGEKQQPWQLGYYDKEKDNVVVFEMGSRIKQAPEQQVLKEKGSVGSLDLEKVRLDAEAAFRLAEQVKERKHHSEKITKKILILQRLDGKQLYNITLVTANFNIINVRISAETGQVLRDSKSSILSLGKQIK